VRVRPLLPREAGQREGVRTCAAEQRIVLVDEDRGQERTFYADAVLDSRALLERKYLGGEGLGDGAGQDAVFDAVGAELSRHARNGFNVCLLAYGHTGSGKTHTVLGEDFVAGGCCSTSWDAASPPPSARRSGSGGCTGGAMSPWGELEALPGALQASGPGAGLLPRVLDSMFSELPEGATCTASFYEIHNERIRDLLGDGLRPEGSIEDIGGSARSNFGSGQSFVFGSSASSSSARGGPSSSRPKVHFHPRLGAFVSNIAEVPCEGLQEALRLVFVGARRRTTAATALNDRSSRSHAIFILRIEKNGVTNSVTHVDLAGREQERLTQCRAERFKELTLINRSLFHLARCVRALNAQGLSSLSKGDSGHHFRNSKLTMVLGHSLAGNSHTAVVGTISPARSAYEDSLATLRFCESVKQVKTRPALPEARHEDVVHGLQDEVRRLESELLRARSELLEQTRGAWPQVPTGRAEAKLDEDDEDDDEYEEESPAVIALCSSSGAGTGSVASPSPRESVAGGTRSPRAMTSQPVISLAKCVLPPSGAGLALPGSVSLRAGSIVLKSGSQAGPMSLQPATSIRRECSMPAAVVAEAGTGGPPTNFCDAEGCSPTRQGRYPSPQPTELVLIGATGEAGGLSGSVTRNAGGEDSATLAASSACSDISTPRFRRDVVHEHDAAQSPKADPMPALPTRLWSVGTNPVSTSSTSSSPPPEEELLRVVEQWLNAAERQPDGGKRSSLVKTLGLVRSQLVDIQRAGGSISGSMGLTQILTQSASPHASPAQPWVVVQTPRMTSDARGATRQISQQFSLRSGLQLQLQAPPTHGSMRLRVGPAAGVPSLPLASLRDAVGGGTSEMRERSPRQGLRTPREGSSTPLASSSKFLSSPGGSLQVAPGGCSSTKGVSGGSAESVGANTDLRLAASLVSVLKKVAAAANGAPQLPQQEGQQQQQRQQPVAGVEEAEPLCSAECAALGALLREVLASVASTEQGEAPPSKQKPSAQDSQPVSSHSTVQASQLPHTLAATLPSSSMLLSMPTLQHLPAESSLITPRTGWTTVHALAPIAVAPMLSARCMVAPSAPRIAGGPPATTPASAAAVAAAASAAAAAGRTSPAPAAPWATNHGCVAHGAASVPTALPTSGAARMVSATQPWVAVGVPGGYCALTGVCTSDGMTHSSTSQVVSVTSRRTSLGSPPPALSPAAPSIQRASTCSSLQAMPLEECGASASGSSSNTVPAGRPGAASPETPRKLRTSSSAVCAGSIGQQCESPRVGPSENVWRLPSAPPMRGSLSARAAIVGGSSLGCSATAAPVGSDLGRSRQSGHTESPVGSGSGGGVALATSRVRGKRSPVPKIAKWRLVAGDSVPSLTGSMALPVGQSARDASPVATPSMPPPASQAFTASMSSIAPVLGPKLTERGRVSPLRVRSGVQQQQQQPQQPQSAVTPCVVAVAPEMLSWASPRSATNAVSRRFSTGSCSGFGVAGPGSLAVVAAVAAARSPRRQGSPSGSPTSVHRGIGQPSVRLLPSTAAAPPRMRGDL